jgi:protein-disulfide isomerase
MSNIRNRNVTLGAIVFLISAISPPASAQEKAAVTADSISECAYSKTIMDVEDYGRLVSISDPFLGNFDGRVKVYEYFDPNCPHCKTMHPIMKTVIKEFGDRVTFYLIPFVLWPYSVPQVEALYVASQDGKYYEMLDAQYELQHSGGLSEAEVRGAAKDIGLDPDLFMSRVQRGLNNRAILERRQSIVDLGVKGTPSIMVNGRFVDSNSKTLACMTEFLQKALDESE